MKSEQKWVMFKNDKTKKISYVNLIGVQVI